MSLRVLPPDGRRGPSPGPPLPVPAPAASARHGKAVYAHVVRSRDSPSSPFCSERRPSDLADDAALTQLKSEADAAKTQSTAAAAAHQEGAGKLRMLEQQLLKAKRELDLANKPPQGAAGRPPQAAGSPDQGDRAEDRRREGARRRDEGSGRGDQGS